MKTHILGTLVGIAVIVLLSTASPEVFLVATSVLLIVLPIISFGVVVLLWMATRMAPDVLSLRSRAEDAVVLWFASMVGAVLGLNRLFGLGLTGEVILGLLAAALVGISIPAVSWVITFREYVLASVGHAWSWIKARMAGREEV